MWSLQVVLFPILLASARAVNLYPPPKVATLSERPFQVAVLKDEAYWCAATIISEKCALTACSCVQENSDNSLGKRDQLEQNYTLVTYTRYLRAQQINWEFATDVFVHNECNTQTNENDVAILCAKNKLIGFPAVIVKERTKENVRGIVSGWGISVQGEDAVHNDLRRAYMRVISLEECRRRYAGVRHVPDSALCAVATDEVRGFCAGDIGGPLTHGEGLIGIAVTDFGCGRLKYPGIFTNVSRLSKYIDHVVKAFESEVDYDY